MMLIPRPLTLLVLAALSVTSQAASPLPRSSPEAADKPHVLHSLSKSFTSTAVGLAVAEVHKANVIRLPGT